MTYKINAKGKRFGKLVAIDNGQTIDGQRWVSCVCDCGSKVTRRFSNLRDPKRKNQGCGCQVIGNKNGVAHGGTGTRLYKTWEGMKQRCYNPNKNSYPNYGGRGISVCEEWVTNFSSFRNWAVDNGYKENLTIERIDNDGDYEPENCTWIELEEQVKNKRNNIFIKVNGKKDYLKSWCDKLGLNYNNVYNRMWKNGLDPKGNLKWYIRKYNVDVKERLKEYEVQHGND